MFVEPLQVQLIVWVQINVASPEQNNRIDGPCLVQEAEAQSKGELAAQSWWALEHVGSQWHLGALSSEKEKKLSFALAECFRCISPEVTATSLPGVGGEAGKPRGLGAIHGQNVPVPCLWGPVFLFCPWE